MSDEQKSAIIDRFTEKLISRKMMAWLTCTGFMIGSTSMLTSSDYVTITAIYIGGQSVIDAVSKLRGL